MHTAKFLSVAWPFLASCFSGGARSEAQGVKPNAASFSVVSGIETLALRNAHVYPHLVVDSASLVSVARMTAGQIAELTERLRGRVSIGEPTAGGACQRRPNALCWSMEVVSFALEGDSARVRVEWIPVSGCGDYSATFLLDRRAAVVEMYDRVTGDCVQKPSQ